MNPDAACHPDSSERDPAETGRTRRRDQKGRCRTEGREFVVTLHGSHTVFCLSGKPGHAETLANETALYLLQSAPLIRGSLCFKGDFKLEEIGQLGTVNGLGGQYVIPLTFSYVTDLAWSITPDRPALRHIDMRILLYPD